MTNKAKLAFDMLEQGMEVLSISENNRIMGGTDPSDGDIWVVGGETFVWSSASNSWVGNELNTVVITTTSTSSSGGNWSWSGYSYGTGSYWTNMLSSGGYFGGGGGSTGSGSSSSSTIDFYAVDSQIRTAVNSTGLAAGFTGTAMDGLAAITAEIGFSVKTFSTVGTKIGAAGVVIGGVECVIAVKEAVNGEDPWTDTDTLNAISTSLGVAALVPGPHSIICGGLSVMISLVGTAYSN